MNTTITPSSVTTKHTWTNKSHWPKNQMFSESYQPCTQQTLDQLLTILQAHLQSGKHPFILFELFSAFSNYTMDAKLAKREVHYSPQGYWKGIVTVKKGDHYCQGLRRCHKAMASQASTLAGLLPCVSLHCKA